MNSVELKHRLAQGLLWTLCAEKEKKNFVVSPVGLGSVLAMLYAGVLNEPRDELRRPLYAHDDGELHAMYKSVINNEFRAQELKVANRIYVAEGLEVQPSFEKLLKVNTTILVENRPKRRSRNQ